MSNNNKKLPKLEDRFLPPKGWKTGSLKSTAHKGKNLHFGYALPDNGEPEAVVVILQGLSEFSEKYFETVREQLAKNRAVFIMDWMGQGRSDRYLPNPHKRHAENFGLDVDDLHQFITNHVQETVSNSNIPMIMLAHSMGGNIGMNYLTQYKDVFNAAAFSAMLGKIQHPLLTPLPEAASLKLTEFLSNLWGENYALGSKGDWTPITREIAITNIFSDDPVRKEVHNAWMKHDPALQIGDITNGFGHQANVSCARLRDQQKLASIKIPVMMAFAGKEHLVDNMAGREIAAQIPNATTIELPDSKHEIMMESDNTRDKFFNEFEKLLADNKIIKTPKPS